MATRLSILRRIQVFTGAGEFNYLKLDWSTMGGTDTPDIVTEISGNYYLLDPNRPPSVIAGELCLWFSPPLPGGAYAFEFSFSYENQFLTVLTEDPMV